MENGVDYTEGDRRTSENKNRHGYNNTGGFEYLPALYFWAELFKGAGTKRKAYERA